LPQVLRRLMDEQSREVSAEVVSNKAFQRAYALIVPLGIVIVVGVLMVFVMPKYQQIMKDFGIRPPAVTMLVIDVASNAGPPLALVLVIALIVLVGRSAGKLVSGRQQIDPLRWLMDRVIWYTPVIGQLTRDRGLADVCNTIADSLDAGRPMNVTLMDATQPHLNRVLAHRVERWSMLSGSGADVAGAARSAGFPPLVSGMTSAAIYNGDLAAAMRFLGRYYDSRFSRLALLLRSAAMPIMALVLGSVVATVALSVFLPIIALIDVVMRKIYGTW
jgi:type IV pilus assembly protein PilC